MPREYDQIRLIRSRKKFWLLMPFLHPCPVPSAECDKLRRDGCRSSQYYSQGPTFATHSSPPCDEDQDEDEEADQKVRLLSSTRDPGLDPRTEKGRKWGNLWNQNKARFLFFGFFDFLVLTSIPWWCNTPTPGETGWRVHEKFSLSVTFTAIHRVAVWCWGFQAGQPSVVTVWNQEHPFILPQCVRQQSYFKPRRIIHF